MPSPIRRKASAAALLRYRLLRHLPGPAGLRYDRKLGKQTVHADFDAALAASSGLIGIDLGANLGKYTRRMAAACRHVHAFEPDPWTCGRLREALADLPNVTVHEAAAGIADGTATLYRRTDFGQRDAASEGSTLLAEKSNIDAANTVTVRVADFPAFLRGIDTAVGVLKIDIEGAELDLLDALLDDADALSRLRTVFVETHENRIAAHRPRVDALRARVKRMRAPRINLYWT